MFQPLAEIVVLSHILADNIMLETQLQDIIAGLQILIRLGLDGAAEDYSQEHGVLFHAAAAEDVLPLAVEDVNKIIIKETVPHIIHHVMRITHTTQPLHLIQATLQHITLQPHITVTVQQPTQ